jgi:rhodanese-related sulfurtransferase
MSTSTPSQLITGPVEYFRAKLEYETTPYALMALLESGPNNVCLLDVREQKAYAEGHIPGARSIPLESLVTALSSLPKDKTIVTYCGDIACALSPKAALELAQKGFRVQHLLGGIAEWAKKGYPVAHGWL